MESRYRFQSILAVKCPKIYEKQVWVVLGWPKNFHVNLKHTFNH